MKSQKKIGIVVILCISLLFSLLMTENYAVDGEGQNLADPSTNSTTDNQQESKPEQDNTGTQGNNTDSSGSSGGQNENSGTTDNSGSQTNEQNSGATSQSGGNQGGSTSTGTPTAGTTTAKKSNNANLSNLGIRPHDFKGFKAATTSYEVVVPEDTETIEVYATAQHAKAKIEGTGSKKLEKGENKAEVVVTAEDGTKKTYTLNIIREVKQEEPNEPEVTATTGETEGKGLAELKVNYLSLSPTFKTNTYAYTVKYIGEDTKLDINAKPTDESYTVDITGNEDLKEGENIITILVSDKDGNNVATYQVTVNKSLIDEEAIAREEAQKQAQKQKLIVGIVLAVVIVVAVVVFIIIRYRKNNQFGNRFEEDELEDEYDDWEDEEDNEDMPKAFLKKKKTTYEDEYEENEEDEDDDDDEDEDEESAFSSRRHKGKRFK